MQHASTIAAVQILDETGRLAPSSSPVTPSTGKHQTILIKVCPQHSPLRGMLCVLVCAMTTLSNW